MGKGGLMVTSVYYANLVFILQIDSRAIQAIAINAWAHNFFANWS